jgi:Aromatic acid exporter family member 1
MIVACERGHTGTVAQLNRLWAQLRSAVRQLLWWVWPAYPASWRDAPSVLRPAAVQIARLTIAAVLSYVVANAISPGTVDLTAPLTALLVVQASTVGTLQMGLVRVGAVLTGVLVAVGVSTWIGLSWWSLGAVIAASLVLAKVLRLGEQSLETPITAMLILAVSSPHLAGEVRVANTLIGTAVGIAFSLFVPVPIPNARAVDAVRRVARSQAALVREIALTLTSQAPHPEQMTAWSGWTEEIEREVDEAQAAVKAAEEARRLNPRALAVAKVHQGLQAAIDRLDRCLAAERALLVVIGREAPSAEDSSERSSRTDLQRAFAVVLDDLADALLAFGDLVRAEYGSGKVERVDVALTRALEIVRETRAVLTELVLLNVDARRQTDLWMLQGSVLAAVEHLLQQLDLEHRQRGDESWLERHRLSSPEFPVPVHLGKSEFLRNLG